MKKEMPENNVLQFPGKKTEVKTPALPENQSTTPPPLPAKAPKAKAKKSTAVLGGMVLAIAFASAAVNNFAFNSSVNSSDMASVDGAGKSGRSIASVDRRDWTRDAAWEKQLAERLAKPQDRQIASIARIGQAASRPEQLRWGILQDKYTILYREEAHTINSISLQDPTATPSYILDRAKFLKDYGYLLEDGFHSAKLMSIENVEGKTLEAYILMDKDQRPMGNARFELDQFKRLLSLKVESI